MYITIEDLRTKEACKDAVSMYYFNDGPKINWDTVKHICVYDEDAFDNIAWLARNFGLTLVVENRHPHEATSFIEYYIQGRRMYLKTACGLVTVYQYENGLCTFEVQSNGEWSERAYNDRGQIVSIETPRHIDLREYNSEGILVTSTTGPNHGIDPPRYTKDHTKKVKIEVNGVPHEKD